jgi:hypothetical protein
MRCRLRTLGEKTECDLLGGGTAAVWAHHVNVRKPGSGAQRARVFSRTPNTDLALERMVEGARDVGGTSATRSRSLTAQLPHGTRGRRKRKRGQQSLAHSRDENAWQTVLARIASWSTGELCLRSVAGLGHYVRSTQHSGHCILA